MGSDHDDDYDDEAGLGDLTRMVITVSIGVAAGCLVLLALAYVRGRKVPGPVLADVEPPSANGNHRSLDEEGQEAEPAAWQ